MFFSRIMVNILSIVLGQPHPPLRSGQLFLGGECPAVMPVTQTSRHLPACTPSPSEDRPLAWAWLSRYPLSRHAFFTQQLGNNRQGLGSMGLRKPKRQPHVVVQVLAGLSLPLGLRPCGPLLKLRSGAAVLPCSPRGFWHQHWVPRLPFAARMADGQVGHGCGRYPCLSVLVATGGSKPAGRPSPRGREAGPQWCPPKVFRKLYAA